MRSFDTVVVTSALRRATSSPGRGPRPAARSCGCRSGVDLDTFRPHPAPRRAGRGPLRLTHVGRLSREKSPHLAVATAVELHRRGVPVRLDVYGDGPHLAELVDLAGDAPVTFHGFIEGRDDLSRRIGAADVALSVCPTETFGLAVLEALASGTPVVTADRGGARELVDASSGGWGRPQPAALADAVLEVARRPAAGRRAAARARAELFPWSATVDSLLAVHEDLAGAVRVA